MQREVADHLGIDRTTYIHYEENERDYYPIQHMEKLADLYDVPVTELLDEYNLFLYGNQGRKIRTQRTSLGMIREQYAKALGELIRLGGWGHLLDHAGSAYDMGREAIRTALTEEDLKKSPSVRLLLIRKLS